MDAVVPAITWSPPDADGFYDSGWLTLAAATSGTAKETAVAIGGDSTGPIPTSPCGPPGPMFELQIYVDEIGLAP